jgi:hypothetical protein
VDLLGGQSSQDRRVSVGPNLDQPGVLVQVRW